MPVSRSAAIDGSNIAYLELSEAEDPKLSNILAVRKAAMQRGWEPTVIVDASLRYEIDDPQQLEKHLDDEYEQFQAEKPWVGSRRLPVMIVEGQVVLDDRDIRPDE